MLKRIADSVIRQIDKYGFEGLDVIKALIVCALDATSADGWSVDDYDYIITDVLYRLGTREQF